MPPQRAWSLRWGVAATLLMMTELPAAKPAGLAWENLAAHDGGWTRGDLRWQLDHVYAPGGHWREWISLEKARWVLNTGDGGELTLRYRQPEASAESLHAGSGIHRAATALWRDLRLPAEATEDRPFHVALDPGHIGGDFAAMEGRQWSVGAGAVFREGEAALAVCERVARQLQAMGFRVSLVREANAPVSDADPASFSNARDFYVGAEIRARAAKVNALRPDLVVAVHFNAIGWAQGDAPTTLSELTQETHAHILLNGSYGAEELADAHQRLAMLDRLLSGVHFLEAAYAEAFAASIADLTGLPPFAYGRPQAHRVNANPYAWTRNLLANRIYRCPVVYLELHVANSRPFYERWNAEPEVIIGDYAAVIAQALQSLRSKP